MGIFKYFDGGIMAVKRGLRGDNVIYRRASGESMAVILTGGQGPAPAAPVAAGFGTGGTLAAATYTYRNTYVKDGIESPASANSNAVVTSGSTSRVEITVAAVNGATSYKIYGRTGGSFLLVNTITAPTVLFSDTGADTPAGAAPTDTMHVKFRTPYAGHAESTGILPGLGANQYQNIY
jgi:hypothetical protein